MNQTQKNYIRKRIEGVRQEKHMILRKKLTTKPVRLTADEKYDLIKSGAVKLVPKSKVNWKGYDPMRSFYDFSKHETPMPKFPQSKYVKLVKKINYEANKIIDEVMLGDAKEAIAMIRAFENKEF